VRAPCLAGPVRVPRPPVALLKCLPSTHPHCHGRTVLLTAGATAEPHARRPHPFHPPQSRRSVSARATRATRQTSRATHQHSARDRKRWRSRWMGMLRVSVCLSPRPRAPIDFADRSFFSFFSCVGRFCATCCALRIVSRWYCCSAVLLCCFSDVPTAITTSNYSPLLPLTSSCGVGRHGWVLQAKVVSVK
jgi:hypothetical protein